MPQLPSIDTNPSPPRPAKLVHWPLSLRRRILFAGCYLGFLCVLVWMGNRLYWNWEVGVPLTDVATVWDKYYPELRTSGVLTADVRRDDQFLDVLILAGSTLETAWGDVESRLKSSLQKEIGSQYQVRIFNLAAVAHTSRDSLLKYSRIADKPFDLILIYDGFNDCRMNNCPREAFRDDYTHCVHYRALERRLQAGTLTMPMETLDMSPAISLGGDDTSGEDVNIARFGSDLKTPGPLRHNLEEILSLAARNETLVVLQTFAYHIPDDYSDQKFKSRQLDYSTEADHKRCTLGLWGLTPNVIKCADAHNSVIRELARQHAKQTVFVDQHGLIPHDGKHFVDPCHFTLAGCQTFVDNVVPAVVPRLRERTTR